MGIWCFPEIGSVMSTRWTEETADSHASFTLSVYENKRYKRCVLSDQSFLAQSALPYDILSIIFCQFLETIDTMCHVHKNERAEAERFQAMSLQIVDNGGLLCYKLPPATSEVVSHCGIKLCGKYFRLQTTLKIVNGPYFMLSGDRLQGEQFINQWAGMYKH